MANWVYIKSDSYLYRVFGDRPIKVDSLIPATPREKGCPPCYWVLASDLSDTEMLQLSIMLYQQWQPECNSIADAEAYIREKNLPLAVINTKGCMTDEQQDLEAIAVARFAANRIGQQTDDDSDFEPSEFDRN